jgi:hypothetical protein
VRPLVEVPVENGESVLFAIRETEYGAVPTAKPGQVAARAAESLQNALSRVRPAAEAVLATFQDLPERPAKVSVRFGITFTATAQVVIAEAAAEAHFEVTLEWG